MAGYAARTHPSEGTIHDLWAKALVLEDPGGRKAALVTLDLCGIGPDVSNAVRDAAKARFGLGRDRIVLACSHTHCGPVVGKNLIGRCTELDDAQRRRVETTRRPLIELDRHHDRRGLRRHRCRPSSPGGPAGPTSR